MCGRRTLDNAAHRDEIRGTSPIVGFAQLLVFPHRDRANVADPAVGPGLGRINRCAAPTAPLQSSERAAPEESRGGPINYPDVDQVDLVSPSLRVAATLSACRSIDRRRAHLVPTICPQSPIKLYV